jgi:hypothetical protein
MDGEGGEDSGEEFSMASPSSNTLAGRKRDRTSSLYTLVEEETAIAMGKNKKRRMVRFIVIGLYAPV